MNNLLVGSHERRVVWPPGEMTGYTVTGNDYGGTVSQYGRIIARLSVRRADCRIFTEGGLIFLAEKSG